MFFVWLLLYGIVMLLSRHFSAVTPWAVPAGLLVTCGSLVGYLLVKGRCGFLRIKPLPASWKQHLFFVPYLLPGIWQLWRFGVPSLSAAGVITMLLVAVQEEVLFRGLLLPRLCAKHLLAGCLLTSLAFAGAHLLNLQPAYGLLQAVYALCVGVALSGIALSCQSLLPCMGIHFWLNISAAEPALFAGSQPLFWLCVAAGVACGVRSIYALKKKNVAK